MSDADSRRAEQDYVPSAPQLWLYDFLVVVPNARGVLPELMHEVGFHQVEETSVIATPTGSISLYRAERG